MPRIELLPETEIAPDALEEIVELVDTIAESMGSGRHLHTLDLLGDQQPVVQWFHTSVAPSNRG